MKKLWEKIKDFFSKFKKWIIGTAIIGTAIAAGVEMLPTTPPIPSFIIDGREVAMVFTDDNVGEDLIIRADSQDYFNPFGNFTIHYSITNNSGEDQTVKTMFSFNDRSGKRKHVENISEYIREESFKIDIPTITYIKEDVLTATGTNNVIIPQLSIIQAQKTKWSVKTIEKSGIPEISNRKDVKGMKSIGGSETFIKKGETKFFRAKIAYVGFNGREEFFIEAFGDQGGYGHL